MEIIFKNAKEHIDNLILSAGPKIKKIIVTHDEYNNFADLTPNNEMKTIGYRRFIYKGVEIHAMER